MIDSLVQEWPVTITELAIVGHSMGGLVARSAYHYGCSANHRWPQYLRKLIFLGTPHHGTPLERWGNLINVARPRDSWVICGSALGLIEKAVEFAAGRIEGALLLFRAVVDQWAAVGPNRITNKFLGRDLS